MLKRLLSLVLAALIAVPAPALPAQVAPPSIERPVAHGAGDAGSALPRLAQRLSDTIPPLYMLGGDDKIAPVALWNAATDAFPSTVLTHTRPSQGMTFDSTGKLTYAPNNLLPQSNTFSNAAWFKSNCSVSNANAVSDPVGGTQASTVTATAAGGYISQAVASATSSSYINSIWIKRRTGTGNISLYDPGYGAHVIAVTSSWQQFYYQAPPVAGNAYILILIATSGDAVDVYSGTLSAVTYETTPRTGDQVITTSAAYYGPRAQDYDNTATLKGFFIWESRKWDALWNRDFTNAVWSKTNVTAALNQTGIDGVSNAASSLTATANNGTVLQNITLASSARAQSAWVKRLVGSGAISMTIDGGTTWTDVTSQISASYAWVTVPTQTLANPSVGFKFATSGDSIAVDFFGNEGGTVPTPRPIPVTSAAVTVAADVVNGSPAGIGGVSGTLITEYTPVSAAASQDIATLDIGGALNPSIGFYLSGASVQAFAYNGSFQANLAVGTATSGSTFRAAIAWSGGTYKGAMNGGAVQTASGVAITTTSRLDLGKSIVSGGSGNGWYKSFAIYNQRLPDATLQAKSVVGASYAANDNVNPFAPKFAANDNLPVHWRIAL